MLEHEKDAGGSPWENRIPLCHEPMTVLGVGIAEDPIPWPGLKFNAPILGISKY